MDDQYLKYGFYAKGIVEMFTKEDVEKPETVRWIRNTAASMGIPYRAWRDHIEAFYRDAPLIFVRRPKAGGPLKEIFLPTTRVFSGPHIDHWFRDFVQRVDDDVVPRVRKEAKLRVMVFGTLIKAHYVE